MKTDNKVMSDLLDAFADELREQLKPTSDEEGKIFRASASTLNVVRQFLKDNGISAQPAKGSPLGHLTNSLPTFDDEEDGVDQTLTH